MKAFYFAIAIAAFAVYADAGVAVLEKHPITWYDCSRKPDGNYEHPYDCTRFISCSGGIASERDCANCNIDPVRCPAGRTVYNVSVDACLWADETTCSVTPTDPTTEVPTTTEPSSTTQGSSTSSTEQPTTTQQPIIPTKPVENGTCDPLECRTDGYCDHYLRCDNTTDPARWVRKKCGTDLVWNPLDVNGKPHKHGGNCDLWRNLDKSTNETYRTDEKCLRCFFNELGECSRDYEYQAPELLSRTVEVLSCSEGLVFSKKDETCLRCDEKLKENKSTCAADCIANGNLLPA